MTSTRFGDRASMPPAAASPALLPWPGRLAGLQISAAMLNQWCVRPEARIAVGCAARIRSRQPITRSSPPACSTGAGGSRSACRPGPWRPGSWWRSHQVAFRGMPLQGKLTACGTSIASPWVRCPSAAEVVERTKPVISPPAAGWPGRRTLQRAGDGVCDDLTLVDRRLDEACRCRAH